MSDRSAIPERQVGIARLKPAWDAVDGALWLLRHKPTFRVFVWRGGGAVQVYSEATAEQTDQWLLQEGRPVTAVTAAATVRERLHAGY